MALEPLTDDYDDGCEIVLMDGLMPPCSDQATRVGCVVWCSVVWVVSGPGPRIGVQDIVPCCGKLQPTAAVLLACRQRCLPVAAPAAPVITQLCMYIP